MSNRNELQIEKKKNKIGKKKRRKVSYTYVRNGISGAAFSALTSTKSQ